MVQGKQKFIKNQIKNYENENKLGWMKFKLMREFFSKHTTSVTQPRSYKMQLKQLFQVQQRSQVV